MPVHIEYTVEFNFTDYRVRTSPHGYAIFEAKMCWGPLANDVRTYFIHCRAQKLEFYRQMLT